MEIGEHGSILTIGSTVLKELGIENVNNITQFSTAIQIEAQKRHMETHLLLIGGNVKPEKQGQFHKDVDLKLYCPQLATEIFMGGDCPKFDTFASFISDVGNSLHWKSEIQKPWFQDHER